jgi:hypothetical protein
MMRASARRMFCSAVEQPKTENLKIISHSFTSRLRSFFSGAVFASAVGMYVITFQLQGALDEVKTAVHDVSARQQFLERKIAKLNQNE